MYALVQNNEIVQVGSLPRLWIPGDETFDWRKPPYRTDPSELGWFPVTEVPKPADTATTVWQEGTPVLIEGVPTQVWVERDKTPDELENERAQAVAVKLTDDSLTDLDKIDQAIADVALLLGPGTQVGSLRHQRGTVFTNTYQVSAVRSLVDLNIQMVVVLRRALRQVARLTRLTTNQYDSADVGEDVT